MRSFAKQLMLLLVFSLLSVTVLYAQGCPASIVTNPEGLPAGIYPQQYERDEFETLANCTLTFQSNPVYTDAGAAFAYGELPAVDDRLPQDTLVIQPYDSIGQYGGSITATSVSPEDGGSDFLSLRHVNLVRFTDDFAMIVPNIAQSWAYNDDYTELTFTLRQGHKWSDGAPFTAEDVSFWYNDIVSNPELFNSVPSIWVIGDEPMQVEAVDETTVRFSFAAPAPNLLTFFARTHIQPYQPKHILSQFHPVYNPDADSVAQDFGYASWVEMFRQYYNDWKDSYHPLDGANPIIIPTLESHFLVEETPEFRRFVANPYFHIVDTAGNQLPYVNEQIERFVGDPEVLNLMITNGEIDYKSQTISLDDLPLYRDNEANGNYSTQVASTGYQELVYYSFNMTHSDPEMAKIFGDVRFRQAMSLAINRNEINETVYLGQGSPAQSLPADATTVNFVPEEAITQFTAYDPDQANALLDEMGLTERDGDGFRLRFDGQPLVILLQYAPQGGPAQIHELVSDYWSQVGIRAELKEITTELYREQTANNKHDIATWRNDVTTAPIIAFNTVRMVPPFGDPSGGIRTGLAWAEWINSGGAQGTEPPEDIQRLWELAEEFRLYPIGSEDNSRIGTEIVNVHADNLFSIGLIGNAPSPIIVHNRLGNVAQFVNKISDYYWTYPFRPHQWYVKS